jgi:adenylosuccinate synthase
MLRESAMVNGLTAFAMNKLDVFSGLDELRIATAYRIAGKLSDDFPMTLAELERAEPVYETHPGWSEDVTACRDFDALPDAAKSYVGRVEELAGVPVELISVGPGRDQTISRADPFRHG